MLLSLPVPAPEALNLSQQLKATIIQAIHQAGGVIPFMDYMQQALYTPGSGYYNNALRKFGEQGDFITAPELSPLFAECLAKPCRQVLKQMERGIVLELGGGTGRLAADLLIALRETDCLPAEYWLLEPGADLQQQQQETLQQAVPDFFPRIRWLSALPAEPIQGVILANEVMDALPVQRFRMEAESTTLIGVGVEKDELMWRDAGPITTPLHEQLYTDVSPPYESEFSPLLPGWIASLSDALAAGLILLVDYGFPRREYYHPQRDQGTLMCHYRHLSHDDPLLWPGLQDITAHVDFTAVAEAADAVSLQVAGYTTQADFLIDCGLPARLEKLAPSMAHAAWLRIAQQARVLLLPGEMGELFKVMALGRACDMDTIIGFARDARHRL